MQYSGGCSVHWRISLNTPSGVQYTGGYHEYTGDVQYSGGIPWVQGDTMMSEGDIMSTVGVFSTLGGHHEYTGGYHDECGGYHVYTAGCSVHWSFHTNSVVFPMTFRHIYHDIPQCTHDIPTVLMISPRCTEHPPLYCTPLGVLHRHYAGCGSELNERKSVNCP